MSKTDPGLSIERASMLRWTASLGAISAQALALRDRTTVASARGRLAAAEHASLLVRRRPLADGPALFTITPAGRREAPVQGLASCRVSAANASHLLACAAAAAALEHAYPSHRVIGERELRREERRAGLAIASAALPASRFTRLHRPDLVLLERGSSGCLPVAVEVELTVKAPARLEEICHAWARCRDVAGVIYLITADVEAPLQRAVARAHAQSHVVAVPLGALRGVAAALPGPIARSVAAGA